jgi:hypothetical protein
MFGFLLPETSHIKVLQKGVLRTNLDIYVLIKHLLYLYNTVMFICYFSAFIAKVTHINFTPRVVPKGYNEGLEPKSRI